MQGKVLCEIGIKRSQRVQDGVPNPLYLQKSF